FQHYGEKKYMKIWTPKLHHAGATKHLISGLAHKSRKVVRLGIITVASVTGTTLLMMLFSALSMPCTRDALNTLKM
ncbi:MAG: hypothetical protein N0C90_25965, partial [Candidatus Thiodiazotropha endolucinida]|nr:hypothetical protein [Candidatus Thiodiazotropha taylori]MCW4264796.1 hypothetical protein [Candidatus Thiodiazotropha endolucinida]